MRDRSSMNEQAGAFDHPDRVVCPGGPLLVRGRQEVPGPDGTTHVTTRPVTAVCRCERSSLLPWCDGTHRVLPEDRRPD